MYDPHWDGFDGKPKPIWTLETQQENTHRSFLSLLTRKTIRGIFWNCFDDLATDAELSVEQESFDETRDDTKTFSELDDDETTKLRENWEIKKSSRPKGPIGVPMPILSAIPKRKDDPQKF